MHIYIQESDRKPQVLKSIVIVLYHFLDDFGANRRQCPHRRRRFHPHIHTHTRNSSLHTPEIHGHHQQQQYNNTLIPQFTPTTTPSETRQNKKKTHTKSVTT